MSDSRGSIGPPIVVGLILAASFLGLVLYNHQHKGSARYETAAQEQGGSPIVLAIRTPAAEPNPERREWREEQDLHAQREMAKWALLMFIVSGFGVAITGAGVWLIRETLRSTEVGLGVMHETLDEAKKATVAANLNIAETRRIGEAQVRAYLTFEVGEFVLEKAELRLSFEIHNCGQSPARFLLASRVACIVSFEHGDRQRVLLTGAYEETQSCFLGSYRAGSNKRVSIPLALANVGALDAFRRMDSRNCRVSVSGIFSWIDVFDVNHVQPFNAERLSERGFASDVQIVCDHITEVYINTVWNGLRQKTEQT